MSPGTFLKVLSDTSMTNRGGSIMENVVKLGGLEPAMETSTSLPASCTCTLVMTLSCTAWAPAALAAARARADKVVRRRIGSSVMPRDIERIACSRLAQRYERRRRYRTLP